MKRIAATLIGCVMAYAQAEGSSEWREVYFDDMLRPESHQLLSDPTMLIDEAIDSWLINHQSSTTFSQGFMGTVFADKPFMVSVVEVAYAGQYSDIVYSFAEKYLSENLTVFLQVRQSDQNSAQNHEYIGTGITVNNRWRMGDGIGLGVAHARFSAHQTQAYPDWESAETAWELSYFGHLLDSLDAQTSVYYIQHPAQHVNISDSIAAQLRVNFKF